MKKLFGEYNTTDTLAVVSPYPKEHEVYSSGTSGIASYTKNIVANGVRNTLILADTCYGEKPFYKEGQSLVIRCFKKNTVGMWLSLFRELRRFRKVKTVLIQFDFVLYGGVLPSSLIIPFLFALRIFGYNTSIVLHSVLLDVQKLAGHVGLTGSIADKTKGVIFTVLFRLFYLSLSLLTNQLIVLEKPLAEKLKRLLPFSNVTVIPHGVDTSLTTVDKKAARKALDIPDNEHVVLFFGFVNWMKGADFFAKTFGDQSHILGKRLRGIIAGGGSATLKDKPFYKAYFGNVMMNVQASETVSITGYIPQEKIALYFSASDLVVLPYRHFMNASGVLSLAFSYRTPFIVSSEIASMFASPEIKLAMQQIDLSPKDYVFDLTTASCLSVTEKVLKNGIKEKMKTLSGIIADQRSYKNIALLYEQKLFLTPVPEIEPAVAVQYVSNI